MTDFTNLPTEVATINLWFDSSYKNVVTLLGYNANFLVVAQCYSYRTEITIYDPECSLIDSWYPDANEWLNVEVFAKNTGKLLWNSKDVDSYALREFLEKSLEKSSKLS
jgi:hypothetical protein